MTVVRCTRCGQEKPRDAFHKNRQRRNGLTVWCKDCFREQHSARLKNPEFRARKLARDALWRKANPQKYRASKAKHREINNARSRAYRAQRVLTPEQLAAKRAKDAAWKLANRDAMNARRRARRAAKKSVSMPKWLVVQKPAVLKASLRTHTLRSKEEEEDVSA